MSDEIVLKCIERIKARLEYTCTPYNDDDFLVIENGGVIFVLCNPVLSEEAIYDEFGEVRDYVSLRNITVVYLNGWKHNMPRDDFVLEIPMPTVRILRPDLCMKIVGDEITEGGETGLQNIVMKDERIIVTTVLDSIAEVMRVDEGCP